VVAKPTVSVGSTTKSVNVRVNASVTKGASAATIANVAAKKVAVRYKYKMKNQKGPVMGSFYFIIANFLDINLF
jgi:hypothetical protein